MKLKCRPADFRVEEVSLLRPTGGSFGLYRLTKESLGTLEALDRILARWNLPRGKTAYAGLKDKHALTTQYITIHGGPRQNLQAGGLWLDYLGQTNRPVHARDIAANQFAVVVRDLTEPAQAAAQEAFAETGRCGVANYFDDQRFGSLGQSGEFIAKPWCLGNYERALWLALADDNVHDKPAEREQKRLLRDQWGDWITCKAVLARSHRRSVITYLCDKPADFKRALALIRQDLRSIWLAAFQSRLWNRALALLIESLAPRESLVYREIGALSVPFFRNLPAEAHAALARREIPLPSARLHNLDAATAELLNQAAAAEGIELREVRLKFPRDNFFSKGERPALLAVDDPSSETAPDDLYPGRQKLTLRFSLRRGSYATIVVKRITGQLWSEPEEQDGQETLHQPADTPAGD